MSTFLFTDKGTPIGNAPTVCRFMKGIFELKPSKPKYSFVWDVKIVLEFLENLYPNNELGLKELTFKLVMLIALVTAQRAQTLHLLNIGNMLVKEDAYVFYFEEHIKQTTKSNPTNELVLYPYKENLKLCVILTLKEYLGRTNSLRQENGKLFISFHKPYHCVSKETISNWLKCTLNECGIDTTCYSSHSTRAAASSAAAKNNVSLNEIMMTAGWKNAQTFKKFYHRPAETNMAFAEGVLGTTSRTGNSL